MTTRQFIDWCEAYYGLRYNPVQRAEINGYLAERSAEYILVLKTAVMYRFSPRYKALPGIADFEEAAAEMPASRYPENTSIFRPGQKLLEEREIGEEEARDYFREIRSILGNLGEAKRFCEAKETGGEG